MPSLIANFLVFQLGWLTCVLAGAGSWHWTGSILVAGIVVAHVSRSDRPRDEIVLIAAAAVLGALWDSLLVWSGLLRYDHGMIHPHMAPHWIIAMWALFATTLNLSLRWLKRRWMLAMVFGAIGGPLAYYAGFRLGAVDMPDVTKALLVLALGWSVLMPALMALAGRFNGYTGAINATGGRNVAHVS